MMVFIVLAAGRIDKGPDNVGVQVGSDVQLKCMLHHRSCNYMMWSHTKLSNSIVLIYAAGVVLRPYTNRGSRYNVSVSPRRECTLSISRVEPDDAGSFTCTDATPGSVTQLTKGAALTVIGMCLAFNMLNTFIVYGNLEIGFIITCVIVVFRKLMTNSNQTEFLKVKNRHACLALRTKQLYLVSFVAKSS